MSAPFDYSPFRQRVLDFMAQKQLSRVKLAKLAGLNDVVLTRMLSGVRPPTMAHLHGLAKAMGVRPGWLLDGPDGRPKEGQR